MRDKEYFLDELNKRWDSPIARNLKRGFIGNELLNFAANALELNDLAYSTLLRESFPQTASLKGLSLQSYHSKSSFDLFRPPYIKVKVDFSGNQSYKNLIVEPFYLQASVGNLFYYNIENVKISKDGIATFMMYQGRATSLYNKDETTLSVAPFTKGQKGTFTFYKVVESFEKARYYGKLPKTAMTESVIVTDNSTIFTDEFRNFYDYLTVKSKFAVRGEDLSLNVFIKSPNMQDNFRIAYLDVTFLSRSDQTLELIDIGNNSYPYEIISEFDGLEEDLQHSRFTMLKNISSKNSIATRAQVESFVRSYPDVIDAKCISARGNLITIAVKPAVISDTHFDDIIAELYIFGEVITNYSIIPGTPVYFDVILSGDYSNNTVQWIDDRLSYTKLTLNDTVTISSLVQELKSVAPKAMVDFRLSIDVNGSLEQIYSKLKQNSVEFFRNGNLIAWDYYGFIYGLLNQQSPVFNNIFAIGSDFVASDGEFSYVYDSKFTRVSKYYPNQMPLQGVTHFIKKGDQVLLQFPGNKIAIYQDYQFKGNTNIAKTLLGTVSPLVPSTGGTLTVTSTDGNPFLQGLLWLDDGFLRVETLGSSWDTAVYQFTPDKKSVYKTDLYSYTLGLGGSAFGSVSLHGTMIIILLIVNKDQPNEETKTFIKDLAKSSQMGIGYIHPITTTIGNTCLRSIYKDDICILTAFNGTALDVYAVSDILFAGDNANPTSDIKKIFTLEEGEEIKVLSAKKPKEGGITFAAIKDSNTRIIQIVDTNVKVVTSSNYMYYLQNLGSVDYNTGVVNIDKTLNIDKVEAGIEGTITDRDSAYPVLRNIVQI